MIIRSLAEKKQRRLTQNTHATANRLRRYYLPASTFPPPGSTGYGGRNTASTASNSQNTTPTDNAVLQLIPGASVATATWRFKTSFVYPPTITVTAMTTNPNGPQELSIVGLASAKNAGGGAGVTIQSTDHTDTRYINVHATGNPY